jgi:hypothetical protein
MHVNYAGRVFSARMTVTCFTLVAGVLASGLSVAAGDSAGLAAPARTMAAAESDARLAFTVDAWPDAAVARIDPEVLRLALSASQCATASGAVRNPATLTIIDYSKASVEPRLWVLDLRSRELVYEELVSHGQGSGGDRATRFSNQPDSHQTSLGLYVTEQPYVGRNGYSLRLDGLDKGFNDRARERAIVMHGAPYVNVGITKSLGRLGRSHGCPAVRDEVARELIDRVKGGSLLFAYYPDHEWLRSSKFLGNCGN